MIGMIRTSHDERRY